MQYNRIKIIKIIFAFRTKLAIIKKEKQSELIYL